MSLSIAIVICTYHRPELLRRCVESVLAQARPDDVEVTIYVVDNSDDRSARTQVAELAESAPIEVRWLEAHPANISVARNAGIAATHEPFVAFIDDDNTCEPGWLEAISEAARQADADVWFGRIVADFEPGSEPTPAVRQLFTRAPPLEPGTRLHAFGRNRVKSTSLTTNNAVFRRATAFANPAPFDQSFGHGGGEDYDLFCRLQRRGAQMRWLPTAVTTEFVPRTRCDSTYLRKRFFAGGQAFAAAISGTGPDAARKRWMIRAGALVQAVLLALQLPRAALAGRARWTDYGYRYAGVLGKLSFGAIHPLYRNYSGRRLGVALAKQENKVS